MEAGTIDAWFWGHEHRLRIYAPYRGVTAGRNIGFGAIPVAARPGPHVPLPGLPDAPGLAVDLRLDVVDGADTHGFALLDLAGDRIDASYWALTRPDGPIWRETIGAGDDRRRYGFLTGGSSTFSDSSFRARGRHGGGARPS